MTCLSGFKKGRKVCVWEQGRFFWGGGGQTSRAQTSLENREQGVRDGLGKVCEGAEEWRRREVEVARSRWRAA
jgi:hypothetical protein